MKTYRRLLLFASPLRSFLPWYLLFTILATIFSTLNFAFFAPILDVLFQKQDQLILSKTPITFDTFPSFKLIELGTNSTFIGQYIESIKGFIMQVKDFFVLYLKSGTSLIDVLAKTCVILVFSAFFSSLFQFLASYYLAPLKGKVVRGVRTQVYEKILQLHLGFFSDEHRGDIISRMTNDVQEIETTLLQSFHTVIKQPITIIVVFATLFYISTSLTLFSLLVLPISAVLIAGITKKLRGRAKEGQHFLGEILSSIDEALSGIKVVQSFTAETYMSNKFYKQNKTYERLLRQIEISRSLASPISQFFGILVVVVILYFGGKVIFEGTGGLDAGTFLVFILLFASVISPIKSLANSIGIIQRGLVAGERLFTILDRDLEIENHPNAQQISVFQKNILFENVQFKYDEIPILKGINLEIKKGETVALVGPSGGGKSTMIDLIPRFHNVNGGKILIDGLEIEKCELASLRNQMGIVTQKPILFHDTVYNNIAFGMDVSKVQVIEAAKIANAHDFILGLEDGYDTVVGDGGGKLSGGQQQRVTIARAVLKDPAIFLLDEATSALDTESEKLIQSAFDKIMKDKTSVVIAHRLSTIRNADKIVVIKEGEIVEVGTHNELMLNEDGLYRKLAGMQNA